MSLPVEELAAPAFPLRKGERGYFAMSTGEDVIRENVQQILGTEIGERVMRPTFGCEIERFLFAPSDEDTARDILDSVRTGIRRWEPRVDLLEVKATRDTENTHQTRIAVTYRIRDSRRIGTAEVVRERRQ